MGDAKEGTSEMMSAKQTNEIVINEKTTNEIVSDKETKEIVLSENTTNEEILSVKKTQENVCEKETNETLLEQTAKETVSQDKPVVVFVLGGPGGGKTTQCAKVAKEFGFTHLSSGELLRQRIKSDPENGPVIEAEMKEGESVAPDITMEELKKAMEKSENNKFILDGFPFDEETRATFEAATNIQPELVLFFDCSEEERERRILSRKQQGRPDDNPETVRKRFKKFQKNTLPVVEHYRARGIVLQVDAGKLEEEVFKTLKSILEPSTKMQAEDQAPTIEELERETSELLL
ncbi:hypothetical protein GH714_019926 [Hevea brasiliensis]|uniref:adenylate kinase n=1 Tax=Hevea brasiliensis TaxID=3981 RepID=A0A6A6L729_HEVBR|nr:hypothetical protein GH714_019926 [Hevea brasiliensis]